MEYGIGGIGLKNQADHDLKNFNEEEFLADVELIQWDDISLFSRPNEMWEFWKNQFLTCTDKHAPMRSKRIENKKSPWITY